MRNRWERASIMAAIVVPGATSWAFAQGMTMPKPASPAAPPPIKTTMDELHRQGGVPKGWTFLLPPGDAAEGRKVFAAMECFTCHEVKGEQWPQATKQPADVGPALSGMGSDHPAEYFAESIVNPNRVILQGPGYTGADGSSKMPTYADTMTVRQLIDLVAYLKSLTGGGMDHGGGMHGGMSGPSKGGGTRSGGGMQHEGIGGMK